MAPHRSRFGTLLVAVSALVLFSAACSGGDSTGGDDGSGGDDTASDGDGDGQAERPELAGDDLRLNEIQVIGSHNSYHLAAVPEIAGALQSLVPSLWDTISYEHRPLPEQLEDYGIRQFELDVFADPEGGEYSTPAALEIVGAQQATIDGLGEPGFKVAHIEDIDFNTTCLTFVGCLEEIQSWSEANENHVPIVIMVETKGDDLRSGDSNFGIDVDSLGVEFARPPEMTPELFDDLEAEVISVFDASDLITPDDVRGDSESLADAVRTEGWPTIGESRGKVMFALVDTGPTRDMYVEDSPNLEGRLFFTSSEPGRPDAAFMRFDDSLEDGAALDAAAEEGFLIRTRTDEPGIHAMQNDVALRDSAMASGAQYLSTDYYVPDPTTGFVVRLPGDVVARCNPVTAPPDCDTVAEG
ncbi:MAG: Ca2+-dependent phosphoinositide-specific phospholipase C [Microthrixaceae bacterium]